MISHTSKPPVSDSQYYSVIESSIGGDRIHLNNLHNKVGNIKFIYS